MRSKMILRGRARRPHESVLMWKSTGRRKDFRTIEASRVRLAIASQFGRPESLPHSMA